MHDPTLGKGTFWGEVGGGGGGFEGGGEGGVIQAYCGWLWFLSFWQNQGPNHTVCPLQWELILLLPCVQYCCVMSLFVSILQLRRPSSDSTMLGEMIFGSVAMTYKGSTVKVHVIRSVHNIVESPLKALLHAETFIWNLHQSPLIPDKFQEGCYMAQFFPETVLWH